jgi:4-methylaminobutanoate oxidase (formaldehyde-forming)
VGGYGFTLGAAVGLGMVESDEPITKSRIESGRWEIEIAGKRHVASASLEPRYDPQLKRVKH